METVAVSNQVATEYEVHHFVTEASTLGLPPGQYPDRLEVAPEFGNGQPLLRATANAAAVIYRQALGCVELHVLND